MDKGTKKKEILLEVGTNELEIMEFIVDERSFGINVSKVLEIMKYEEITPVPHSNKYVEGIFKPRNQIITVLDLAAYLNLATKENPERDILIITNFNNNHTAFHVHSVETIHRISWSEMEKPDETIHGNMDGITTGIARVGEKLITILDFERIMAELNPSQAVNADKVNHLIDRPRNDVPILVAEDSPFLKKVLLDALHRAGYMNTLWFGTGKEAWEALDSMKELELSNLSEHVRLIITDIEMPEMDGHTLCKLVKNDRRFKHLPVIMFSSLINDEMKKKGKTVGADAQISKPEIENLVTYIDAFIFGDDSTIN
ncbi:MAG: chemotaxis protein [Defluviitaleaceae bacterium]|nr:chemotaxis protein [Defluviitaleaceae bacterium]